VVAGEQLKKLLDEMQRPDVSAESDPGQELRAELRPYQRQGAHWLWFMNKLGLGACLADDMGFHRPGRRSRQRHERDGRKSRQQPTATSREFGN